MKLEAILEDILKNHIFGIVKAHMYVIEFQKRGLPHAHILIILDDNSKPRNSDDYDNIVKAEIPDKTLYPQAFEKVTKSMIHGPCGILNPKSPCMEDGRCSKNYPKDFNDFTTENSDGYPIYRRRENTTFEKSIKKNISITIENRWVIPYNLYLVTKYDCHINVEICSSV